VVFVGVAVYAGQSSAVGTLLGTRESNFSLVLVQNMRGAMSPHSFALLLHSGVDLRLAFILCNVHGRAVFFAFGIESNTAPITSREQECCKNGRGGKDDFHALLLPAIDEQN
jgi:hypothetical protein